MKRLVALARSVVSGCVHGEAEADLCCGPLRGLGTLPALPLSCGLPIPHLAVLLALCKSLVKAEGSKSGLARRSFHATVQVNSPVPLYVRLQQFGPLASLQYVSRKPASKSRESELRPRSPRAAGGGAQQRGGARERSTARTQHIPPSSPALPSRARARAHQSCARRHTMVLRAWRATNLPPRGRLAGVCWAVCCAPRPSCYPHRCLADLHAVHGRT